MRKIVLEKTTPRSRNEQEIAGYRDVLNTIHENYEHIPVRASFILQLHRDLYKYEGNSVGGTYKNVDNIIEEKDDEGNKRVRFQPVPAWKTPESVDKLCMAFGEMVLQEPPFTDRGSVVEVFTDMNVWMGIRKAIERINENAVA